MIARCAAVLAVLLAAVPARAGMAELMNGPLLLQLQEIQEAARRAAQRQQVPNVIPVVSFGERRAARYRYLRRDEIFALDAQKRPVSVGFELSDVVETADGSVERLLAVEPNGGAATLALQSGLAKEQAKVGREAGRLQKLLADAGEKAKAQKKERDDQASLERMVAEFPRALRYRFDGFEDQADGSKLVRETFSSNFCGRVPPGEPCFTPRSQEARIYDGMIGKVWARANDGHLVRFETTIQHDVKFGWGMFSARAKKDGVIAISLSDLDGQGRRWVITGLSVHLVIEKSALAAMFSGGTERDHENQSMSDFRTLPDLSYDDGIRLLLK